MAIDFPASPTNGQTHVVGSVTYTWDGTKWTAVAAGGGGSGDIIIEGNTSAEVIDTGSDGRFVVTTEGSERLRVDSSGRLGIGSTSPSTILHVNTSVNNSSNYYLDAGATALIRNDNASGITSLKLSSSGNSTSALVWGGTGSETLIFTNRDVERARIDSSGRLLVGTSSARDKFNNAASGENPVVQVEGAGTSAAGFYLMSLTANNTNAGAGPNLYFGRSRGTTVGSYAVVSDGDCLGKISFQGADGSEFVEGATISAFADGGVGANDLPSRLVFSTTADGASSPTERMRIDNTGYFILQGTASTVEFSTTAGAGTSNYFFKGHHSRSGFGSGGTPSLYAYTNGNLQNANNSYAGISDIKLKENIVDATSQWSDIKALQVRKYNFKEGQTHTQIGLIAQEVELVSPGLVYESPDRDADGKDLGTVTKSVNYSVLYMKAVKALQEAMERIETLEAKVAALENPTV